MENCLLEEGPHGEAREAYQESPPGKKKWQRQRVMNRLQPPFPTLLCCLWGGGTELGREVKLWKKGGVEGTWFKT